MAGSNTQSLQEIPGQAAPPKAGGKIPPGTCQYPEPQCTWYVATQYPVLFNMGCLGNACQWWSAAQKYGWSTQSGSGNPWVGAVVVYRCDLPGSNTDPSCGAGCGHVAVVTKVEGPGAFDVMESNWKPGVTAPRREYSGSGSWNYIQGFIAIPGGPTLQNPGATESNPGGQMNCTPTNNTTGANGGPCQIPFTIPGFQLNIGPWSTCVGGWPLCIDGMVGIGLMILGGGIMLLGVVLAVKNPVEATARKTASVAGGAVEIGSAMTGQPEGMAAGAQMRQWGRQRAAPAGAYAQRWGQAQARVRANRRLSSQRLSVQQQQKRRDLMNQGLSSARATQVAREPDHEVTAAKDGTFGVGRSQTQRFRPTQGSNN